MELHFAAANIHAVVVNVNVSLAAPEVQYIFEDSKPAIIFTDSGGNSRRAVLAALELSGSSSTTSFVPRAIVWMNVDDKENLENLDARGELSLKAPSMAAAAILNYQQVFARDAPHKRIVVADQARREALEGDTFSIDDGFHLYYTSGTTGKPKAVLLSHAIVVHYNCLDIL